MQVVDKQPLGDLVEMNLQVEFEKFRRRPDDWQLPLYQMKLKEMEKGSPKRKGRGTF